MSNIERTETRTSKKLGVTTLKISSVKSSVEVYKLEVVHRPVVVGPVTQPILPRIYRVCFLGTEYDELETWIFEIFKGASGPGAVPKPPVEMYVPPHQNAATRVYWEDASTAKAHKALKGY